ncbi:MAG: electron transfer flavoprotein alpha/beta subunit, partial [Candidatus Binatus sp.]|nr:electron transfer flavoprotein alpha/beta subunit [Candidatus Binatus sp.]
IPLIEEANFDPITKTIKRDGPNVISAFDLRAVSLAVELKNRHSADTCVVTMGPPQARDSLIDALAMGMDRAVHLEDRAFAGADTLATAHALALWIAREKFDLVLLGKYSLDAETGQVGPEIAELVGAAQITGARKLEIVDRMVRAERESDEGFEEVEAAMPVVITCAERVAQPIKVKPGASDAAKSKPIETIRASALGADAGEFGLKGSPTWVQEVRVVESTKHDCTFIDAGDPERAAAEVIAQLEKIGALSPRVHNRRQIEDARRTSARGRDVWVGCEIDLEGRVTRGTLELLSRGDQLAARLGGAMVAIGLDASIAKHAGLLASFGADKVIAIESPALASYTPEAAAEAVAKLVAAQRPWGILLAATERGRDWAPRMAARLRLGLTGDAIDIELDSDNQMVALKPAFGGNIVAPIYSKTYPQLATVRPGVLELASPSKSKKAELEIARLDLAPAKSRLIKEHSLLDPTIVPLEGAEVVVGVGTGIGGPEGVAAVSKFARVLGAGICATRRVTDLGWIPRQVQVGLTGKSIDPRLYFAVGVRGAPNHTCGLKRAQTIIAINNDADALIFERADIGLVADWTVILPALEDAFERHLS